MRPGPDVLIFKGDLAIYPTAMSHEEDIRDHELTLGDLHANPIKLLYILIQTHLISGITAEDYAELIRINNSAGGAEPVLERFEFNAEDLAAYRAILSKIRLTEAKIKLLRFIGDILADRGQNDLFILLILKRLYELGLPMRFLLSNHDLAFLQAYENGALTMGVDKIGLSIPDEQQRSLRNLLLALTPPDGVGAQTPNQVALAEEVRQIIETIYLPNLVALDFLIPASAKSEGAGGVIDKSDSRLTLLTHAPINFGIFRALVQWARVKFNTTSVPQVIALLQAINASFRAARTTSSRFFNGGLFADESGRAISSSPISLSPLYQLAWYRRRSGFEVPLAVEWADRFGTDTVLIHVFGHEQVLDEGQNQFISLDDTFGKSPTILGSAFASSSPAAGAGAAIAGPRGNFSSGRLKLHFQKTTEVATIEAVPLSGDELAEAETAIAEYLSPYEISTTPLSDSFDTAAAAGKDSAGPPQLADFRRFLGAAALPSEGAAHTAAASKFSLRTGTDGVVRCANPFSTLRAAGGGAGGHLYQGPLNASIFESGPPPPLRIFPSVPPATLAAAVTPATATEDTALPRPGNAGT